MSEKESVSTDAIVKSIWKDTSMKNEGCMALAYRVYHNLVSLSRIRPTLEATNEL